MEKVSVSVGNVVMIWWRGMTVRDTDKGYKLLVELALSQGSSFLVGSSFFFLYGCHESGFCMVDGC